MIHNLKTISPYFEDVWHGKKRFEVLWMDMVANKS